jgi:hypothetical protein
MSAIHSEEAKLPHRQFWTRVGLQTVGRIHTAHVIKEEPTIEFMEMKTGFQTATIMYHNLTILNLSLHVLAWADAPTNV